MPPGFSSEYTRVARNVGDDLDGGNALETRRLSLDGPDQPAARISASGDVAWYLTDRLGSVRDVVNDAGTVLDHTDYDAFGNVTSESNPAQGDRFRFQGLWWDGVTGLFHTPNLERDPRTNRWTSPDPSGFAAGDANLHFPKKPLYTP